MKRLSLDRPDGHCSAVYANVEDGTCSICDATGEVLRVDTSGEEYDSGYLCRACIDKAFSAEPEPAGE